MPHTSPAKHPCADCGAPASLDATRCNPCESKRRSGNKALFRRKVIPAKPETPPSVVLVPGLAAQGCRHEWQLGEGYSAEGTCNLCGEVRAFSPHWTYRDAKGVRHIVAEWNSEVFGRIPERPLAERILYYDQRTERI